MNLEHDFVQVSKLSEDPQKNEHFFPQIQVKTEKKVFTKNGTPFSPNSSRHLRSDAHRSQIIGEDVDVHHTQTIGGHTVKLLGRGYIPPSPPGFGTPGQSKWSEGHQPNVRGHWNFHVKTVL